MKKKRRIVALFSKGVLMGLADLVPGISGGTIALITGIYEEFLFSLKSLQLSAFLLLLKGKWPLFWKTINGAFLVPLGLGILVSIFSLASLLSHLLKTTPTFLFSFFFGLISTSCIFLLKKWYHYGVRYWLLLFIGFFLTWQLIHFVPIPAAQPSLWFIFGTGILAICAMILPGISGSLILLLLGSYDLMLHAVTQRNVSILSVFFLGCCCGLLTFSRILHTILQRFHHATLGFLMGMMLAALERVWPWRLPTEAYLANSHININPLIYAQYTDTTHLGISIFYLMLGISVGLFMEKVL